MSGESAWRASKILRRNCSGTNARSVFVEVSQMIVVLDPGIGTASSLSDV